MSWKEHKSICLLWKWNSLMVYTEHQFHSLKGQSTQVLFGTVSAETSVERLMCFTAAFTKHSFSATKHSTSVCVCVYLWSQASLHKVHPINLTPRLHLWITHRNDVWHSRQTEKTHIFYPREALMCVLVLWYAFFLKCYSTVSLLVSLEVCRRECMKTRQTNRWEERGREKNTHTTYNM